jgi:glycosyltransferase involved in cell wall biosynthesis
VIGVQTESNIAYLANWQTPRRRVEVLHNWLAATPDVGCSIRVGQTALAGRKIFVYIGNMGVAQGMDILIELVESFRDRQDLGFLFVGRGRDFENLVAEKAARGLGNVLFFNEIDSSEIPGLLAQCHVGLVALHPKHKTHNIPGKFVSYVQYGLPVLARVSAGTDIARLIEERGVGKVYVGDSVVELRRLAEELAGDDGARVSMSEKGRYLGRVMFSPAAAATQVINSADRVN